VYGKLREGSAKQVFLCVPDVVVVLAPIAELQDRLFQSEATSIVAASERRRIEFIAGRTVARIALKVFGEPPVAIPRGNHNQPMFPQGLVGSISHTAEFAAACIARRTRIQGVGLDLEPSGSVTQEIFDTLFVPEELKSTNQEVGDDLVTILFACKESIYKAVNPVTGEFLDFKDVSIQLEGNRFNALCREDRDSARLISGGAGFIEIEDGLVRSLFIV
jgi:4'-phosphopantetheinyl transferase EntD